MKVKKLFEMLEKSNELAEMCGKNKREFVVEVNDSTSWAEFDNWEDCKKYFKIEYVKAFNDALFGEFEEEENSRNDYYFKVWKSDFSISFYFWLEDFFGNRNRYKVDFCLIDLKD